MEDVDFKILTIIKNVLIPMMLVWIILLQVLSKLINIRILNALLQIWGVVEITNATNTLVMMISQKFKFLW